jgi:opacity protein-like surface antigen
MRWVVAGVALAALALPVEARAQGRPAPAVEFAAGWAGFADEGVVHHSAWGGAARFNLTPRIGIGPELVYMVGPGSDRDLFLTGNLTFDVLAPSPSRAVSPFVVVGGGLFRHSDRFVNETYSSTEGAFTAGGGLRIRLGDRAYIAPEARVGWETHIRLTVAVGVRLGG